MEVTWGQRGEKGDAGHGIAEDRRHPRGGPLCRHIRAGSPHAKSNPACWRGVRRMSGTANSEAMPARGGGAKAVKGLGSLTRDLDLGRGRGRDGL